jgi:hypothetical protein
MAHSKQNIIVINRRCQPEPVEGRHLDIEAFNPELVEGLEAFCFYVIFAPAIVLLLVVLTCV